MDSTPTTAEMRELLVGTWIGVALVVEALVEARSIERDALVLSLSHAEAMASDRRAIAISALRQLIASQLTASSSRQAEIYSLRCPHRRARTGKEG